MNELGERMPYSNVKEFFQFNAFTEEEYAIAVKKDNTELVEQINAALAELKESGKLQEIVDKYISAE